MPYVPIGQDEHDVAPARENVPGGQILQIVAPMGDHEPAAQGVHDAVFPAADLEVPAGQSEQAPASVSAVAATSANFPAGQRFNVNVEHVEAPAREY